MMGNFSKAQYVPCNGNLLVFNNTENIQTYVVFSLVAKKDSFYPPKKLHDFDFTLVYKEINKTLWQNAISFLSSKWY